MPYFSIPEQFSYEMLPFPDTNHDYNHFQQPTHGNRRQCFHVSQLPSPGNSFVPLHAVGTAHQHNHHARVTQILSSVKCGKAVEIFNYYLVDLATSTGYA
jgi:hypothetical protein